VARTRLRAGGDVQLPLFAALYGLDIETDTTVDGLDPSRSSILAVSLSSADGQLTFRGPERQLLSALDQHLQEASPGVLVTWNGSGYDLPFLAERARRARVRVGLRLLADAGLPHRHPPIAGHPAPFRATWHRHGHLDACCLYRTLVPEGTSCSLKSLARAAGLPVVEVDASRVHDLDHHVLDRYVASDAWLTRQLAIRAWSQAGRMVDAA
jgi:hypothetical protein